MFTECLEKKKLLINLSSTVAPVVHCSRTFRQEEADSYAVADSRGETSKNMVPTIKPGANLTIKQITVKYCYGWHHANGFFVFQSVYSIRVTICFYYINNNALLQKITVINDWFFLCSVLCHVVLAMLQFKYRLYCQQLYSTSLQDCFDTVGIARKTAKGRPNFSHSTCAHKSCTSLVCQRADQIDQ